ncbi:MAG: hypothetical protein EBZ91_12585 [Gammaproteobacteria bacterium]|nr:hypothetical protein [Gammaproteobacteria bacterium]
MKRSSIWARLAVSLFGASGAARTTGAGATGFGSRIFSTGLTAFMRSIGFFGAGAGAGGRASAATAHGDVSMLTIAEKTLVDLGT